jgi:hypothetical protein
VPKALAQMRRELRALQSPRLSKPQKEKAGRPSCRPRERWRTCLAGSSSSRRRSRISPCTPTRWRVLRGAPAQVRELERSKSVAKQAQARRSRKALRQMEEEQCLAAEEFLAQHVELKEWLRKGLQAKSEMVEANCAW